MDDIDDTGVTVLGVDILPSEVPRESSEHFGKIIVGVVKRLVEAKQQQDEDTAGIDTSFLKPQLVSIREHFIVL